MKNKILWLVVVIVMIAAVPSFGASYVPPFAVPNSYYNELIFDSDDFLDPYLCYARELYTFFWFADSVFQSLHLFQPNSYGWPLDRWTTVEWPDSGWPLTLSGSCWTEATWGGTNYPGSIDCQGLSNLPLSFGYTNANYLLSTDLNEYGDPGLYTTDVFIFTSLGYWTGGVEGVPRNNFLKLHVSATDNFTGNPIPATNLTIGSTSYGRADSSGDIYTQGEDNKWYDGTVYADQTRYSNYTYALTPQSAYLQIARTGGSGTNLVAGQTNTVIVGEQMALTCLFVDPATGLPSSIAPITNFQWTVPGNYVGDYQANNSTGKVVSFVATNAAATFHWLRGSGGSDFLVQCTAVAKGVTLSASTRFVVRGVDASLIAQVTDVVHVTNNTTLRFSGASNGMRFTYSDPNFDGYTGSYKFLFVQTGTNYLKTWYGALGGYIATSSGLDKDYPYDEFSNTNTARTFDSPSNPLDALDVGLTRSDQYTMWLMFQPTSVTGRPVPLRSVSWNWNGTVTNTPPWTLTSSSPTTAGAVITGTATTSYPEWITNITSRTLIYWA